MNPQQQLLSFLEMVYVSVQSQIEDAQHTMESIFIRSISLQNILQLECEHAELNTKIKRKDI